MQEDKTLYARCPSARRFDTTLLSLQLLTSQETDAQSILRFLRAATQASLTNSRSLLCRAMMPPTTAATTTTTSKATKTRTQLLQMSITCERVFLSTSDTRRQKFACRLDPTWATTSSTKPCCRRKMWVCPKSLYQERDVTSTFIVL